MQPCSQPTVTVGCEISLHTTSINVLLSTPRIWFGEEYHLSTIVDIKSSILYDVHMIICFSQISRL